MTREAAAIEATETAEPGPSGSGDERVDAALGRLAALGGLPVAGHVTVFTEVQQGLQGVLAALDAEAAEATEEPTGAAG